MHPALRELEPRYRAALRAFLEGDGDDEALQKAHEVGRQVIADGLGVLKLAMIHREVVCDLLTSTPSSDRAAAMIERSMDFFHKSLSSFETTLRGFRESNQKLQNSIEQLNVSRHAVETERQRYREQFDFAPDGYFVTDLSGRIQEANVAAAVILHTEQEFLVNRPLSLFITDEDRSRFEDQLLQLQSGAIERVRNWQTLTTPVVGRPFPAALTVAVVRNKEKTPIGLRWLVRDISDLKRAEAERSEFLVREKVARIEAEGARRVAFLAEASTLLAASLDSETTLRNVAQLSTPFLADWCFVYIMDDDGSIRRVAVAYANPAKADLARRLDEQETPSVPEWVFNALVSGKAEIVADLSDNLLASSSNSDEQKGDIRDLDAHSAMAVPLIARGRTLGLIVLLSAESARVFGPADQVVAEDLARRCAFAVDNARLYGEVIIQRDKAEKASRSKDEFLAILSHELRNPLVPILGWSRILKNQSAVMSDDVLAEGIGSLERNARNIQRLVDDCLDLVRTSTRSVKLSQEHIDLNQIAVASIEASAPLGRDKGIKLDVQLETGGVWVVGDRTRLEQVVTNLLTNAIKFTPSGGSVQVRSDQMDGFARILIKDSGIGIAPNFLDQIFEPFRKGSSAWLESDSGLGLGLSIAREITELHSGKIWAESGGLGQGSTFVVALPPASRIITAPEEVPDSIPPRKVDSAQQTHIRVLLVEDASDVLFLMKKELEWNGFVVYAARDGHSGLEIAKREVPDLIVSDIKMPGMDGYQFMEKLREIAPLASIPAIALTGFGMERDADQARSFGYTAHMVKPVDLEQLINLITSLTRTPAA
jgi:PAS domain S-box-containing protein